jgi:Mg-chelatase subunit ChlD
MRVRRQMVLMVVLLLGAVVGSALSLARPSEVLAQRPTATRPTPGRPTPDGRHASECTAELTSTLSADTTRMCDPVTATVRLAPSCPYCMGGISIVFVVPERAGSPLWVRSSAQQMLNSLDEYRREYFKNTRREFITQVGVVTFSPTRAFLTLAMTTKLDQGKSATSRVLQGSQAGGAYEAAGDAAVNLLKSAERTDGTGAYRACIEIVVMYVDFTAEPDKLDAMSRIGRARGRIDSRAGYFYAACVAENTIPGVLNGCEFTYFIQRNEDYFAFPNEGSGKFAGVMESDIRQEEEKPRPKQVTQMELKQLLPVGLAYVPGSGLPLPNAVVTKTNGETELTWNWNPVVKAQPETITYRIQPLDEGTWPISGSMRLDDVQNMHRDVVMATRPLTVTDRCLPPTPTPTDTPSPTDTPTPTATDLPATVTPTSTATATATATATPTRLPVPVYLPILLTERCKPEHRRVDLALVLDASTSMEEPAGDGQTKLQAARTGAAALLAALPLETGSLAAVVTFNNSATLNQPLTGDRAALQHALDNFTLARQTCLVCGVQAADTELAGPRHRTGALQVIVLLTDGRSNPQPVSEAVAAATAAKQRGMVVFTVGVGSDLDVDAMRAMASQPDYFRLSATGTDLSSIYRDIAELLPCPAEAFWGRRAFVLPPPGLSRRGLATAWPALPR